MTQLTQYQGLSIPELLCRVSDTVRGCAALAENSLRIPKPKLRRGVAPSYGKALRRALKQHEKAETKRGFLQSELVRVKKELVKLRRVIEGLSAILR